ncbi:MAG: ferrous iron transport protein A [Candidatus Cloacimonetes bacterium]|nr:ferrous iron transport protein A [Candidatus Cloacimonadota bacterium]
MFRRKRHRRKAGACFHCPVGKTPPCPLSDCPEKARVRVVSNPDRQTLELGIYPGSLVKVFKNHLGDPNLVVGIGDSRFILDRSLARNIKVG